MQAKIEISLYNTDKKELIKKGKTTELAEICGYDIHELHSKLRYCTYKSGKIYYSEKLGCNITFRKR